MSFSNLQKEGCFIDNFTSFNEIVNFFDQNLSENGALAQRIFDAQFSDIVPDINVLRELPLLLENNRGHPLAQRLDAVIENFNQRYEEHINAVRENPAQIRITGFGAGLFGGGGQEPAPQLDMQELIARMANFLVINQVPQEPNDRENEPNTLGRMP